MPYPGRKRPIRPGEVYDPPKPEWAKLDLEEWLEQNVSDPEMRKWYREMAGSDDNDKDITP